MNRFFLFLVSVLILFSSACKKNDNNNQPDSSSGFRLAKMDINYSKTQYIVDFQYDGDKLTKWQQVYESGSVYNVVVNYIDDNVVEMILTNIDDSSDKSKRIYTYAGRQLEKYQEYHWYENQYFSNRNLNFVYDENNRLLEKIQYGYSQTGSVPESKETFIYHGDMLTEDIFYEFNDSEWVEKDKFTFQYEDDRIISSELNHFNNSNWKIVFKEEFFYAKGNTESRVSKIKQYENGLDNEWRLLNTTSYSYNSDGNLVSEKKEIPSDIINTTYYYYEQKKGNLNLFRVDNGCGHPDPYYKSRLNTILFPMKKPGAVVH